MNAFLLFLGHFEAIVILKLVGAFSRQTVLCISEKLSRYAFYHVIENKKAETVMFGVLFALREIPSSLIRSFTYDNAPKITEQKGQVEYALVFATGHFSSVLPSDIFPWH